LPEKRIHKLGVDLFLSGWSLENLQQLPVPIFATSWRRQKVTKLKKSNLTKFVSAGFFVIHDVANKLFAIFS
jgi:hypothetical protein